jgi:hypothetical protein
VATPGVLAGGDQFATPLRSPMEMTSTCWPMTVAEHGRSASSSKAFSNPCERFVFVVAVDRDLVDQAVEFVVWMAGVAHRATLPFSVAVMWRG